VSIFRFTIGFGVIAVLLFFALVGKGCSCSPKWKAYQAAARSDLRNLQTAEEAYFEAHSTFTDNAELLNYNTSTSVRMRVVEFSDSGFVAFTTHRGNDGRCAMYFGKVAYRPVVGNTVPQPGEPYCDMRLKGEN